MFTAKQLRQKYLDFFVSKGHKVIPSASIIPENDPTVLFTTAGMHPLVPYLLGEKHPEGKRLVNAQKCVRLQDIDEVGDNRHDTFFEMLGNWSMGDYWKEEAIKLSWEFLASPQWLGLDAKKIAASVFAGDDYAPRDDESAEIWKKIGLSEHKIAYLPKDNNWWGPAGLTGPCGPDTEIFYWIGENTYPPEGSNPASDEENWLEIWNIVFMQYNKTIHNKYESLKQMNVDTGMGLERTLFVLNGFVDVFQVDTFWPLILKIEEISGHEYVENVAATKSMRVIADHLRTATMIMGDDRGVAPSNVDQGYVARRLIRRAIRQAHNLGIKENFCAQVAEKAIEVFKDVYPEVERNKEFIFTEIAKEESKFRNTLEKGIKIMKHITCNMKHGETIPSASVFDLYQSYGFPIEMIMELAKEGGLSVNVEAFNQEMKKHQELSRQGAEEKFKGGLADESEMSKKHHTATHLLHAALRQVLGGHVEQRGSNITADRLRFDFSHPQKMTEEERQKVEDLVNYAVRHDYQVSSSEMSVAEAKESGAIGLFDDKYGNKVKVYTIGGSVKDGPLVSREICGGPHVERTGMLGEFKIIKEEAVSAGVRRIKAILV